MGRDEGGHLKEKDTPTVKNELEGTETGARQAPETVNHLVLLKHREHVGESWGVRLQQQGGTILWYMVLNAGRGCGELILSSISNHELLEVFEHKCNII